MPGPFLIALLLPSAALAHGGPAGHAHPHGLEGVLLALALLVAGALLGRLRLVRRRRRDGADTAAIPQPDTARSHRSEDRAP